MANPEHLQILKRGVEAWNQWRDQHRDIRPDLREADLDGDDLRDADLGNADLDRADLNGADLNGAYLGNANLDRADLREADLREADLNGAYLGNADLSEAGLSEANLRKAFLHKANLRDAELDRANVSEVSLRQTVFSNTNLTAIVGLETCHHHGPSALDHRTLARSGPLPLVFLRGCGLNDWEIEVTQLYDTRLTAGQVNDILYRIYPLRTDPLIQFYSCFISYASQDYAFVQRLHADLQNKGVRCWFAHEDMKTGDRIRDTIDQQIRLREKLLVVLSATSIASAWVEDEVETALEQERKSPEQRTVLFPITIDHTVEETERAWARTIRRTRHIRDFTQWQEQGTYQQALARLLRDLTATAQTPDIGGAGP